MKTLSAIALLFFVLLVATCYATCPPDGATNVHFITETCKQCSPGCCQGGTGCGQVALDFYTYTLNGAQHSCYKSNGCCVCASPIKPSKKIGVTSNETKPSQVCKTKSANSLLVNTVTPR